MQTDSTCWNKKCFRHFPNRKLLLVKVLSVMFLFGLKFVFVSSNRVISWVEDFKSLSSKLLYWLQFQRQRNRFSGIFSHGSVTLNPDKKKCFVLDFGSEHRSLDQSVELSWKERLHLFLSDPVVLDIQIQMKTDDKCAQIVQICNCTVLI